MAWHQASLLLLINKCTNPVLAPILSHSTATSISRVTKYKEAKQSHSARHPPTTSVSTAIHPLEGTFAVFAPEHILANINLQQTTALDNNSGQLQHTLTQWAAWPFAQTILPWPWNSFFAH
eukprot:5535165-Amphidinium_carterae.1